MKLYRVRVTEFAAEDLKKAEVFYELQAEGLGSYFFDALLADIETLSWSAGIHPKDHGYFKMLARRFPYSIYYSVDEETVLVVAVLDQRRSPVHNYSELGNRV